MTSIASNACLEHLLNEIGGREGLRTKEQVSQTAEEVLSKSIAVYEKFFGAGDVGPTGTGIVSRPHTGSIPAGNTGLLYGKVQSGKTMTSIATVAMATANGFRCFVVLTSDNVWLGGQTADRFRDGLEHDGPLVAHWEEWSSDPKGYGRDRVADYLGDTGVVMVTTKNIHHLENLRDVLRAAGAKRFPALILDDEADNASLNTGESKKNAGARESRIFAAIGDLRKTIPNHVYLQVTATPQSLLLQTLDNPCRPAFCSISKPGETYIGGEVFFDPESAMCYGFDAQEVLELKQGRVQTKPKPLDIPDGLRRALCVFFVGASQKRLEFGRDEVLSMLIHISHTRLDHRKVSEMASRFVVDMDKALRGKISDAKKREAEKYLQQAWEELSRTAQLRPFTEIVDELTNTLRNAVPDVVDADNPNSEPKYRKGMNILVGGNRLGRGVTIKGLFVTYYARDPKQKMMDTVHQHARMFGYRQNLKDVTRFFVPPHILSDFKLIHESDEAMRSLIGDDPDRMDITPVLVGDKLKPTRSNVLNPAAINAIPPGVSIFPPLPKWRKGDVAKHTAKLDRLLSEFDDDNMYYEVSTEDLLPILKEMPSDQLSGHAWEDERVRKALKALAKELNMPRARLNVRRGRDGEGLQLTRQEPFNAIADSSWLRIAKDHYPDQPTLIVAMQAGRKGLKWDDERVYLPVLVMPRGKFAIMFNYSGD